MKSVVLLVAITFLTGAVSAEEFILTELGTLGGNASRAYGVSPSGQVVGWASITDDENKQAFVWSAGSMVGLPSLSDPPWDIARGINANGQVVGVSGPRYSPSIVLWQDDSIQVLWPGTTSAYGINDDGQVVGKKGSDPGDPFLWEDGNLYNFSGTHGGAYAINDCGQIVGYLGVGDPSTDRIFLYSDGAIYDLGRGEAYGLNDVPNVQVVGYSNPSGQAFLWQNGSMQYLGQGTAYGINDSGQVVGTNGRAFLYTNGQMWDLNDLIDPGLNWTLIEAIAINDLGQIVGWGTNPYGQERGFLLTVIPEPATICLLAAGSCLFWSWRRQ